MWTGWSSIISEGDMGGTGSQMRSRRGDFQATYGVCCVSEVSSLGGSFPTVRATVVRWDAVLAGDLKWIIM